MTMPFQAGSRAIAAEVDAIVPQLLVVPGDVPVTSTSWLPVLQGTVSAATYLAEGVLECTIGATATAPRFRFDLSGGAVVSSMLVPYSMWQESNSGEQAFAGNLTGTGSGNNTTITATFGAASVVQVKFAGIINFSSPGALELSVAETTASDTYTVSLNSWMKLTQQVT